MNFRERVKKFAAQRRAIRELSVLDDHALEDVGLQRNEIRKAILGR
ncbi:DUF1127 domain-containing protein [Rhizobium sp. LEGMi198b]